MKEALEKVRAIYTDLADRPFGCRTHFCEAADGLIPRQEILDLIRRLEEVDRESGGDGPHQIEAAIADALQKLR